jgi:hypothetical protein
MWQSSQIAAPQSVHFATAGLPQTYVAVTCCMLDLAEWIHYATLACSSIAKSSRTRSRDCSYSVISSSVWERFLKNSVCCESNFASLSLICAHLTFVIRYLFFRFRRIVSVPGSGIFTSSEGTTQSYCSIRSCASAILIASEVRPQRTQKCSLWRNYRDGIGARVKIGMPSHGLSMMIESRTVLIEPP